ncbi:MAG: SDR family oxidoreductase [Flavobacteriaceae bacterium]
MREVVLITGGSSGIGKAIGDYLVSKHYIVYGTSRNPSAYKGTLFKLLPLDVTKPDTIVEVVSEIIKREGRIDVLINNAGVGITGPIEETPTAQIKKAFDTNFYGPLEVLKVVVPQMRKQKCGFIINITSIAGYMGLPYRGIYAATKAALEITTEAYRMELMPFGIKMTNVAPGDFATNIASSRYHAPVLEESPYKEAYAETLKMMNEGVTGGNNPIEMGKAIHQIIKTKDPKVHYRVGSRLQKLSVFLKKILPDKRYEIMLMKHYKLKGKR